MRGACYLRGHWLEVRLAERIADIGNYPVGRKVAQKCQVLTGFWLPYMMSSKRTFRQPVRRSPGVDAA
jgi:hypothetical protein